MISKSIQEKIKVLPDNPGVYIMKDSKREVLYVGKAKSLKKRVANYFGAKKDARNSVLLFVPKIRDIEYIITDNEKEAFLLENNLIKKLKPKYNINLRDDKDFLCIRIDLKDDFPKMTFLRRPKNDGSSYFGPYTSGYSIKLTMRSVQKIFPLRRCSKHVFKNRSRPCVLHQIKLCMGPCVGLITKDEYMKLVNGAMTFLKGETRDIINDFKSKMKNSSRELRYEEAAKYRDKIKAIDEAMIEQKIVSKDFKNKDIFGFSRKEDLIGISLLSIREGRLSGGKNFKFKTKYLSDIEAFTSLISQYYLNKATLIPDEIFVPFILNEKSLISSSIAQKGKKSPRITVPKRGEHKKLVNMANQNANEKIKEVFSEENRMGKLLEAAKVKFNLKKVPDRIEGYDISNLQGKYATGSMVVFTGGNSDKSAYRKFRIKTVKGPDDYSMMNEVLSRRLSNDKLGPLPDLIVIDGGKGQLNIAAKIMIDKSYEIIDLISIAKEKTKGNKQVKDRIYIRGRKNYIILKNNSPLLHLIGRIRDEAHRFALSYHKKLRSIV